MVIRGPSIEISIRLKRVSNYLGGIYDLDYSGTAANAEMTKITKASCAAIKATKASLETKHMVSKVSVIRKIGYKGALASFPLADYMDTDNSINDMYRAITKKH